MMGITLSGGVAPGYYLKPFQGNRSQRISVILPSLARPCIPRRDGSSVTGYSPKLLSIDRKYSRFRRALSLGEPIPGSTSCSTST